MGSGQQAGTRLGRRRRRREAIVRRRGCPLARAALRKAVIGLRRAAVGANHATGLRFHARSPAPPSTCSVAVTQERWKILLSVKLVPE